MLLLVRPMSTGDEEKNGSLAKRCPLLVAGFLTISFCGIFCVFVFILGFFGLIFMIIPFGDDYCIKCSYAGQINDNSDAAGPASLRTLRG